MKIISIVFNIASLLIIGYLFVDNGAPKNGEWAIIFAFVGANVTSLLVVCTSRGESFLGLWLQRKKLEEMKRIELLKTK